MGISKPEGWAGPAQTDALVLASTARGKLSALNAEDFSRVWTFPTGEEDPKIDLEAIYDTPVVMGDTVYLAGYNGDVYALGLEDGSVRWQFEADDPIIASLAASETAVFFKAPRYCQAIIEWISAVPVSHGINDPFSTGSQAQ